MSDPRGPQPTAGDNAIMDIRLVDIVLRQPAASSSGPSRLLLALLIAVAAHAALVLLAQRSRPSLEAWSAQMALQVHQELAHTTTTDLERAEPPKPPPSQAPEPPEPPPQAPPPEPGRIPVPSRAKAAAETPAAAAPPAGAGAIVSREDEPVVDLSGDAFVSGTATAYAGGASLPGGVGASASANSPQERASSATPQRATHSANKARSVRLDAGEWRCPWPDAAMSADIYEAFVIIRVRVNPQGLAQQAEVLEDPGHGFGQAAIACAKRTRFAPARDQAGTPIFATSPPIRVRFVR